MGPPSHTVYEFGPFHLDSAQHVLLRDAQPLSIPPKAFEILLLLLENRGTMLSKADLQDRVWPDSFVDENNLTQQISALRRILGESPDQPQYIETVPRLGYRFIAPVHEVGAVVPLPAALQPDAPSPPAILHRRPAKLWIAASLVAATLLFAGGYFLSHRQTGVRAANPQRIKSLAVLPLKNLSGDAAQDFFADAMTDALITDLAQIHDLRVISGTSAMHYKDTHKTLPEIARELNVEGVVEGTVFRSGDHVRITAQLIEASADRHLWARSYERDLRDVLTLQDEVARGLAGEIKANLTPLEELRLTSASPVNTEAYQLYLQGQYFESKVTEDSVRKSIGLLQQSIAKDPNFSLVHVALAAAYVSLASNGYESPLIFVPKAKAELTRALELDESLAEAYMVMAQIKLAFDWDWPGAEKNILRALELNPNAATAMGGRDLYFLAIGHFDEAIAEIRRVKALNPVDVEASLYVGQFCLMAGRYDESIVELKKTLELDPNFLPAHAELALAYTRLAKRPEAAAEYEKTRSLMSARQALVLDQWMAPVEILLGKRTEALNNAEWWSRESGHRHIDAVLLAAFYAELGLKERAFQWLAKGFEQRSPSMAYLKVDKNFPEDMRSDPRFQAILRRMNFPN